MSNNKTQAKANISLTNSTIKSLRKNRECLRALEDLHGKSFYTIQEWIRTNNASLCRHDSLQVIGSYLKLEIEDMVEYPNGVALINGI